MEELELMFEDEAGIYLPQVVAEENKRNANEHERLSSEEERLANEKERVENEEYRKNTMKEIETKTDAIIDEMNANLRKISFVRRYKAVHTAEENQDTFSIPSEYTETSMLDIHVNGFTLNDTQYSINSTDLTVTLVDPVDAGTTVEIVVTRLTTAHIEDYNSLFYDDTAIKEGLEENTADIQSNEDRIIALEAENAKQKEQIEYLEKVKDQALKDHKKIPFEGVSNHIEDTGELPMPISINGGIEQDSRVGYNLVNIEDYSDNNKFMTSISSDKFVATSRLSSTTNYEQVFYFNNIPLKTGITYTLREVMKILSGTPVSGTGQVELYNGSTWVKVIVGGSKKEVDRKTTFTVDEDNTYRIRIKIAGSNDVTEVFSVEFSNLMIYEGTEDKPYEQYGQMPSLAFPSEVKGVGGHYDNVVENKNVFKFGNVILEGGIANLTVEKINENTIKVNGTTSGVSRILTSTLKKPIDKNMIVTAKKISGSISKNLALAIYQGNNSWTRLSETPNFTDIAYTKLNEVGLKSETYQIGFWVDNGITFDNAIIELQFEYGDTASEIIEHQEQLLPIDIPFNMYSGKPYKENGKWYRDVEWVKYEFTGEENWVAVSSVAEGTSRFYFNKADITSNTNVSARIKGIYSNKFKAIAWYEMYKEDTTTINAISVYDSAEGTDRRIVIRIDSNVASTVEEFKAFLKENDVYAVYKLATPTVEEITDTTLIEQLEELSKAHSYYEVTNINTYKSSEDVADLVLSGNALMSNDIRLSKLESGV